ncbi:MAG: hypothetical protein M1607_03270 [Patescibacteria group bacterium]|nr:hypothetical protein [Patescibacteria group bacterium]
MTEKVLDPIYQAFITHQVGETGCLLTLVAAAEQGQVPLTNYPPYYALNSLATHLMVLQRKRILPTQFVKKGVTPDDSWDYEADLSRLETVGFITRSETGGDYRITPAGTSTVRDLLAEDFDNVVQGLGKRLAEQHSRPYLSNLEIITK